jgi:hypothetical protein
VVAFEQFFSDCDAAEDFVHAELERRGLRHSNNREFFRCSASDVVKVILSAPGISDPLATTAADADERADDADLALADEADDGLILKGARPRRPWTELYEMADCAYYGHEDHIQDYAEALKLFQDCARLGSPLAFERVGDIFRDGQGVRGDLARALRYYKAGAAKGNYCCRAAMALLFFDNDQIENGKKCFERYLRERSENQSDEFEEYPDKHVGNVYWCVARYIRRGLEPNSDAHIGPDAEAVLQYAHSCCERLDDADPAKQTHLHMLRWLEEHFPPKLRRTASPAPTKSVKPERLAPPVARSKGWTWWRH